MAESEIVGFEVRQQSTGENWQFLSSVNCHGKLRNYFHAWYRHPHRVPMVAQYTSVDSFRLCRMYRRDSLSLPLLAGHFDDFFCVGWNIDSTLCRTYMNLMTSLRVRSNFLPIFHQIFRRRSKDIHLVCGITLWNGTRSVDESASLILILFERRNTFSCWNRTSVAWIAIQNTVAIFEKLHIWSSINF